MYASLHTHSEFSTLDGLSRISEMADRLELLGQDSLALTDHGNLHGSISFYQEFNKRGLKPILGLEAYVAPGDHTLRSGARDGSEAYHHLVLLAQNNAGWKNLLRLSTKSWLDGYYYKPRVDLNLIADHSEGLIALSGCPSSSFQKALRSNNIDEARKIASWFRDVFDDRYYFEIQRHKELPQFEPQLIHTVNLSQEMNISLVATQDSHYTNPGDAAIHDLLLCIGTGAKVSDEKRFNFSGDDFYLMSEQEMLDKFSDYPESVTNTQLLADRCDVSLEFGRLLLPEPDVPEGVTPIEHLRDIATKGLNQLIPNPSEAHIERLNYELYVIEETGFAEYFLIVMDFSNFARENGISQAVRGSAASSLVLHSIGVSEGIDPLEHDLVFERFLNLERREMPDIDMDFADHRRDEVIQYVRDKYGEDRVAAIATFGRLGAKQSIRDTSRALDIPLPKANAIAGLVPQFPLNLNIDQALEKSKELAEANDSDEEVRDMLDNAKRLFGALRQPGIHAAAIVISREPLTENIALFKSTGKKAEGSLPVAQFDMNNIADIGLLKMDFLGLRNLTILDYVTQLVYESTGELINPADIPDGDERTYDMITAGDVFGVFQLESDGMRRVGMQAGPKSISDIAALISLYRPGPMQHIDDYIARRHGQQQITYPHDDLSDILEETFGIILYQDQVLHIARKFAGYTLGEADIMRKAMGKKIAAVMQAERGKFVAGAQEKGHSEQEAIRVFELIEPFAGYAFNKAHAISFARITYQTGWFKAHYPNLYMAAMLNASIGNIPRLKEITSECYNKSIKILTPDVNKSQRTFAIDQGGIRFGLNAVKDVSNNCVDNLISEREKNGEFKNLDDFVQRLDGVSSKSLEALAKVGTFDEFASRSAMVTAVPEIIRKAKKIQSRKKSNQASIFQFIDDDEPPLLIDLGPAMEASDAEILAWEKDMLGMYVSEHPLQKASDKLRDYFNLNLADVNEDLHNKRRTTLVMINKIKERNTKAGDRFGIAEVEDMTSSAEIICWPEKWPAIKPQWKVGNIALVETYISKNREEMRLTAESSSLYSDDLEPPQDAKKKRETALRLVLRETGDDDRDSIFMAKLEEALSSLRTLHPGECPILLHIKGVEEDQDMICSDEWRLGANEYVMNYMRELLGNTDDATLVEISN